MFQNVPFKILGQREHFQLKLMQDDGCDQMIVALLLFWCMDAYKKKLSVPFTVLAAILNSLALPSGTLGFSSFS